MAIIELHDVSRLYGFGDATTLALDEVSLEIERGEFLAIMGASGSGKSTLLNIIGLLDKPTHGKYTLDSRSVARLRQFQRSRLRRDKIGFIFQSFNLLPRLTIIENVALPLSYKGMTQTKRLKIAGDVLERVGLRDKEHYYPKHLSGGQLQRAAIARALVSNPSIIIADEPTGNLDSVNSRVVMELLSEIHRQGNTILMVTHNAELTRYASRVIYMNDGSIVKDESTAIGEVASSAHEDFRPQDDEEEIAKGVSALMKDVPGLEITQNVKKRTAKKPVKKDKKSSKTKKKTKRSKS